MAVMFEGAADPLVTGSEELGVPNIFYNIDVAKKDGGVAVKCSWDGNVFIEIDLSAASSDSAKEGLTNGVSKRSDESAQALTNGDPKAGKDAPTWFWYRCVPSVGNKGVADAESIVIQTHEQEPDSKSSDVAKQKWHASTMTFTRGLWKTLPMLHHVASALADMPVYGDIASDTSEREGLESFSTVARFVELLNQIYFFRVLCLDSMSATEVTLARNFITVMHKDGRWCTKCKQHVGS
ncbi:hypothetical protein ACHAQH_008687 [Verticillium albo-atrum]